MSDKGTARNEPVVPTELEILYRDDDVVAIQKPSGLLVHRGWANDKVVAMTILRDQIGTKVFPLHRLDRGASGIVLFALSSEMASAAGKCFMAKTVEKHYLALVRGVPAEQGAIDHAVPKKKTGARVAAQTLFRRKAVAGRYSLVEVMPITGRLHQIRRHMKHISCPLIGDVRYGKGEHNRHFRDTFDLHRLALHCHGIALPHPRTGEALRVEAPLEGAFASTLRALEMIESVQVAPRFGGWDALRAQLQPLGAPSLEDDEEDEGS